MTDRISFYKQISRNKWKSFFLILIVFSVLIALGYIIAEIAGPDYFTIILIVAIIVSIVYVLVGYYASDKIALASVNAKEANPREYPQFHNIVEGLCLASGMPKPRLYVFKSNQINAFASGRDPKHAVICVTTGTLEKLNKQELEGVLAHELSHIANFDIRFMTLTAVLVGMVAIISEIFLRTFMYGGMKDSDNSKSHIILIIIGILLAILAPIVVQLVQFAISRKREFVADASAVKFVRSPTGLINALKKISHDNVNPEKEPKISKAVAPLFIAEPIKNSIKNAFSTHPPLKDRIEILQRM